MPTDEKKPQAIQTAVNAPRQDTRPRERAEWDLRTHIPDEEPAVLKRARVAAAREAELDRQVGTLLARGSVPRELTERLAEARAERRDAEAIVQASQQVDPWVYAYREGWAIAPYVDPLLATRAALSSDALTTCIEAMGRGVAGHGFELEPVVGAEAFKLLSEEQRGVIEAEKLQIESWLRNASPDVPFIEIYRRTVAMKETTGDGWWELLPNESGEPCGIEPMPSWSMRITPDAHDVLAPVPVRKDDGSWGEQVQWRRMRRALQLINGRFRWFKFIGDPRFIDGETGRIVGNEWEAKRLLERGDADQRQAATAILAECKMLRELGREAHEVMHFLHFGVSGGVTPYGVPRWNGATYSVIGRQKQQIAGMAFWDNNGIPRLVVTCSGALFDPSQVKAIEDHFRSMRGVEHLNDVLVIQAAASGPHQPDPFNEARGQIKIEIHKLNDAVMDEASFRGSARDWLNDVRRAFSLPPILTGDSDDYARAVADTARLIAEELVFNPERVLFDHAINHRLFPRLGYRHWTFRSGAAHISDESAVVELLKVAHSAASLSTEEVREIVTAKLGRKLPAIGQPWASRPSVMNGAIGLLGQDPEDGPRDPADDQRPGNAAVDGEDPDAEPAEVGEGEKAQSGAGGKGKGKAKGEADAAEAAVESPAAKKPAGKRRVVEVDPELLSPGVLATAEGLVRLRQKVEEALRLKAVA